MEEVEMDPAVAAEQAVAATEAGHRFRYVKGLPDLPSLKTETIDGTRYYVTPNGVRVPSVTTVLGHFKKKHIKEWRDRVGHEEANKISRTASTRGTRFHTLMEKYVQNVPVKDILTENVMPDMRLAFNFMSQLVKKHINNIHYVETPLFSEELGVAGRTDLIAEVDGTLAVIDFKTSAKIKKEEHIQDYFEQGSAYCAMYEEMVGIPVNKFAIFISVSGHECDAQIFIRNKSDHLPSFKDKIKRYHAEKSYV